MLLRFAAGPGISFSETVDRNAGVKAAPFTREYALYLRDHDRIRLAPDAHAARVTISECDGCVSVDQRSMSMLMTSDRRWTKPRTSKVSAPPQGTTARPIAKMPYCCTVVRSERFRPFSPSSRSSPTPNP